MMFDYVLFAHGKAADRIRYGYQDLPVNTALNRSEPKINKGENLPVTQLKGKDGIY